MMMQSVRSVRSICQASMGGLVRLGYRVGDSLVFEGRRVGWAVHVSEGWCDVRGVTRCIGVGKRWDCCEGGRTG